MNLSKSKVTVRPESIPAGISLCDELRPNHSVLIIDIGGTTTDISMVSGQMTSVSRILVILRLAYHW